MRHTTFMFHWMLTITSFEPWLIYVLCLIFLEHNLLKLTFICLNQLYQKVKKKLVFILAFYFTWSSFFCTFPLPWVLVYLFLLSICSAWGLYYLDWSLCISHLSFLFTLFGASVLLVSFLLLGVEPLYISFLSIFTCSFLLYRLMALLFGPWNHEADQHTCISFYPFNFVYIYIYFNSVYLFLFFLTLYPFNSVCLFLSFRAT